MTNTNQKGTPVHPELARASSEPTLDVTTHQGQEGEVQIDNILGLPYHKQYVQKPFIMKKQFIGKTSSCRQVSGDFIKIENCKGIMHMDWFVGGGEKSTKVSLPTLGAVSANNFNFFPAQKILPRKDLSDIRPVKKINS